MADLFQHNVGSFQPIAKASQRYMSEAQRQAKLRMIRRLEEGEISGWLKARKFDDRIWFPGELAALRERAGELGMRI